MTDTVTSDVQVKEQVIYQARATTTSNEGHDKVKIHSELTVELSLPQELGGPGNNHATNPEQLFAAAYSACFFEALKVVAVNEKIELPQNIAIESIVGVGMHNEGYFIETKLEVSLPEVARDIAQNLIDKTKQIWPCAKQDSIQVVLQ